MTQTLGMNKEMITLVQKIQEQPKKKDELETQEITILWKYVWEEMPLLFFSEHLIIKTKYPGSKCPPPLPLRRHCRCVFSPAIPYSNQYMLVHHLTSIVQRMPIIIVLC